MSQSQTFFPLLRQLLPGTVEERSFEDYHADHSSHHSPHRRIARSLAELALQQNVGLSAEQHPGGVACYPHRPYPDGENLG